MRIFRTSVILSIWHKTKLKQKIITAKHYSAETTKLSTKLKFIWLRCIRVWSLLTVVSLSFLPGSRMREREKEKYILYFCIFYILIYLDFCMYVYRERHKILDIIIWVVNVKEVLFCSFKGIHSELKAESNSAFSELVWFTSPFIPYYKSYITDSSTSNTNPVAISAHPNSSRGTQ